MKTYAMALLGATFVLSTAAQAAPVDRGLQGGPSNAGRPDGGACNCIDREGNGLQSFGGREWGGGRPDPRGYSGGYGGGLRPDERGSGYGNGTNGSFGGGGSSKDK